MFGFIELTGTSGRNLRLNVAHITYYRESHAGEFEGASSAVFLGEAKFPVKETPEEIDALVVVNRAKDIEEGN